MSQFTISTSETSLPLPTSTLTQPSSTYDHHYLKMSPKCRATPRKCSDAENLGLKPKPSRKMNRVGSGSTLRDSSLRRRNRVISGLAVPPTIMTGARRHKAAQLKAAAAAHHHHHHQSHYALPTPPESPMSMCIAPPEVSVKDSQSRKVTVQFPKRLARPQTKPIRQQSVAACDPAGLKDVPVQYVRQALDTLGPQCVSHQDLPAISSLTDERPLSHCAG